MTDTTSKSPNDPSRSPRWQLVIGAVVILAALIVALVLVTGGDDDSDSTATTDGATTTEVTTETTTAPSTEPPATDMPTTEPSSTEPPSTETPIEATRHAIWPWSDTSTRFSDPVEAATNFATDYLGFTDPVVGDFQAGDSRSGEVEVTAGTVAACFGEQATSTTSAAARHVTFQRIRCPAPVAHGPRRSGWPTGPQGTRPGSDVQRAAFGVEHGFVHGLRQRRVREDRVHDVRLGELALARDHIALD